MEQLKPCPFCGYSHDDGRSHVELNVLGRAKCFCYSASVYGKDEREALEAWNRRSDNAKLVAALKAMLRDEALSKLIEDIGEEPDWMKVAREALREAGEEW